MRYQSLLALPVAACLVIFGPSFAQAKTAADTGNFQSGAPSTAGMREAMSMVPARADLVKTLDARDLHVGQQFQAKLADTVHLKNGPELPKGTVLVGTVATDSMNKDGQTSTLALRFTQADLQDGKTIPIKATIVAIYPPDEVNISGSGMSYTPNYWTDKTLRVDQLKALPGVDLHSRIAAMNSAVFVSNKKNNMKLNRGSELAIAIAAQGSRVG